MERSSLPTVLQRAKQVLLEDERVLAAYGFGSIARGEEHERSDVDIAVLLDRSPSLSEELRLRAGLTRALRRDDVDLVILNHAPPLLRYEVVGGGIRLVARDPEEVDRYERTVALHCFDTASLRETQQRLAREAAS